MLPAGTAAFRLTPTSGVRSFRLTLQFICIASIIAAWLNGVVDPARHAFSHSASCGKRNPGPHRLANSRHSHADTLFTGCPGAGDTLGSDPMMRAHASCVTAHSAR
jgi:hypothetical protein